MLRSKPNLAILSFQITKISVQKKKMKSHLVLREEEENKTEGKSYHNLRRRIHNMKYH